MAQLATDKWLNKRYGVRCKEYPIYRTIKFSNVSNGPATSDIFYGITAGNTINNAQNNAGNVSYTVFYRNPVFTWTNRIAYNSVLYDVYKLTSYSGTHVPPKWNNLTFTKNSIEQLFIKGWPYFGTIYIRSDIADSYKAPYDDGSESYYYINNKTNIGVNMFSPVTNYPSIMVPNLGTLNVAVSGVRTSYANNPLYGRDIYYNFGTISTTKFATSDPTIYYKCTVKVSNISNSNLTAVYIYQDESSILNIERGGISRDNTYEFDASVSGDKIGKLQPLNDGDKGVVISNNSDSIIGNNISSLKTSFNCVDTSLTSNISLTQDYFERKIYELRHVPMIGYAAASSSKGIHGTLNGKGLGYSTYYPQTYLQLGYSATMGGNIKIFPPTLSGLDVLLGNKTSLNFNQIFQFPYFNNTTYKPTTAQINSQVSTYIPYDYTTGLHINNVLFSTDNIAYYICNDPNHTNDLGGLIPTLSYGGSYYYINALSGYTNTFEGFTYGMSRFSYNVSNGQSIAPFCIGYLSSYISPGLEINKLTPSVEVVEPTDHAPEWQEGSDAVVDGYLCDIYYSDYSTGVSNGEARMKFTISGVKTFRCYIRAWAEDGYDYVVISNLNNTCTRNSYKVKGVNSQTEWTTVEYENLDGGTYVIEVLFTKDGSVNRNDDKGYIAIPKLQDGAYIDLSSNYLPYKTIDYLTKADADKIYYHPTLYNTKLSTAYTNGYISKGITDANGYAAIPVVMVPSSICPNAASITTSSANINATRINASTIRLSVTLPTKLGPFKLRNFAYHTTASNNPLARK